MAGKEVGASESRIKQSSDKDTEINPLREASNNRQKKIGWGKCKLESRRETSDW